MRILNYIAILIIICGIIGALISFNASRIYNSSSIISYTKFEEEVGLPIKNAGYLFVDNKGILYAATLFKNSVNHTSLYYSMDKGITWKLMFKDLKKRQSRLIFVDSRGYIFYGVGDPPPAILYRSTDDGKTFEKVLEVNASNLLVSDSGGICEDKNGNLYVGEVYPINRTPVVYKSIDGGSTWFSIYSTSSPANAIDIIKYDPYQDALYLSYHEEGGGYIGYVMKSIDGGKTWKKLSLRMIVTGMVITNKMRIFIGDGPKEIIRTFDDKTFEVTHTPYATWYGFNSPWSICRSSTGTIYVGSYGFGQVIASPDNGETWSLILNQREMRIVHSIVSDEDGFVYIGTYAPYPPGGSLIRIRDIPAYKLPEPSYCIDWPFYNAKIRDTKIHYGMRLDKDWKVISSLSHFSSATVLIANDLDQPITIIVQGSWYKDFKYYGTTVTWNISSAIINPGERIKMKIRGDFQYIRCLVKAETKPTSGILNIWVIKKN